VVSVRSALSSSAHSSHLTVTTPLGLFKGYVAKEPSWVFVGRAVDVVALPHSGFAILLAPDGGCRPLTRPVPHATTIPRSYARS